MAVEQLSSIRHSAGTDSTTAMEALVTAHQRMIFALCYRMTGSVQDAEDMTQETFVHACRRFNQFRGESQVSSWLYRIALNHCLNWRARNARTAKLHQEFCHPPDTSIPPDASRAEQVNLALQKLPPKQRAAIVLTVYDGLNHAQAARVLGCSEATVSWRVFVARGKLKKWLGNCSKGGLHD